MKRALVLGLSLALVGCGNASKLKQTALDRGKFNAPITLDLNRDAGTENQAIAALHGVDTRHYTTITWSGGPSYGSGYQHTCAAFYGQANENRTPSGQSVSLNARVSAYPGGFQNPDALFNWMVNHKVLSVYKWRVLYTNLSYPGYGNVITWYCPIVRDAFLANHASDIVDSNGGFSLAIGRREITKWTYANQYDANEPGEGQIKIFAGTFTYTVTPLMPDISFNGSGNGSVKMHLDPDNGTWVIDKFELHDPGMTLQNSGPPSEPFTLPPQVEVFEAIKRGDWTEVRKLLEGGLSVDVKDAQGRTPLMLAVQASGRAGDENKRKEAVSIVRYLLAHHALVNLQAYNSGWTALTIATWGKSTDVLHELLAHGANPNIAASGGDTPLHEAVYAGSLEEVKLLIAHGAEVNAENGGHQTPIESSQLGSPIYKYLKAHGATAELVPYMSEQMKVPTFKKSFSALFAGQQLTSWMEDFLKNGAGVEGPGHVYTIDGKKYRYFSICQPHNCTINMLYVMFTNDGHQAWAMTQDDRTEYHYYGDPPAFIRGFLLAHHQS